MLPSLRLLRTDSPFKFRTMLACAKINFPARLSSRGRRRVIALPVALKSLSMFAVDAGIDRTSLATRANRRNSAWRFRQSTNGDTYVRHMRITCHLANPKSTNSSTVFSITSNSLLHSSSTGLPYKKFSPLHCLSKLFALRNANRAALGCSGGFMFF